MKIFLLTMLLLSNSLALTEKKIGKYHYFYDDEFIVKCEGLKCSEFNFDKQTWKDSNFHEFSKNLQKEILKQKGIEDAR